MFQYATRHQVYADTDLITLDEAQELFNKNKEDFLSRPIEEEAEMVLWINCVSNSSYGDSLHYWCADDFRVIDGQLYKRV